VKKATRVPVRALRADAQINEERLLGAAAKAFARDGARASLKAIAEDAGVGIGTLYRRFPTREALVAATYRSEVDRVCAKASELLAARKPARALRAWMSACVEFLTTKQGMADVLRVVLAGEDEFRVATRARLVEALALLLDAARTSGDLRRRNDAVDVLTAIAGVALIAGSKEQRAQADRLLDLLFDGLRFDQ
jgi:AcrR family transcriptional regulator